MAAFITFIVLGVSAPPLSFRQFGASYVIVLPLVIAGMALRTQLLFKNDERVLTVGPSGWSTRIGSQSGARSWAEVAAVHDAKDAVVIVGTNGNGLIIPSRAFSNAAAKRQFFKDAHGWHVSGGV